MRIAYLAAGVLGAAFAGAQPTSAIDLETLFFSPAELDLGVHPALSHAQGTAWLLNTGGEPMEITGFKRSCGCIGDVGLETPLELPPRSALEMPLSIRAPRNAGERKQIHITFAINGEGTMRLPIHLAAEGGGAPQFVAVDPPELDLGLVTAGVPIADVIVLQNIASADMKVTKTHSRCGCVTFPEFSPFVLGANDWEEVLVEVDAPYSAVGTLSTQLVYVSLDKYGAVSVPIHMRVDHPVVGAVKALLGAQTRGDHAQAARYLARDARVWFNAKEGPGEALDLEAARTSSEACLSAAHEYDSYRLEDRTVQVIAWEGNGEDRVPVAQITFWLDETNLVKGVLCERLTVLEPEDDDVKNQGSGPF